VNVCLVAVETFAWGKYGGFGRATRTIGRELVQGGITASAVVPRRAHQAPIENLDGIRVHGLTLPELLGSGSAYERFGADIFHSQEPSLGTYLATRATRAAPKARHVVTFRDTRDAADWRTERGLPSASKLQVLANRLYEDNWPAHRAVRRADLCCVAARMLAGRAQAKYGLAREPQFLPTPVVVPERVEKDREPTVCFVARCDRRKRPELFFELARRFPSVRFLAAGRSLDPDYERNLRDRYGKLHNPEMLGFIDQFRGPELSHLLGRSWILVNTAAREGLPNAFIEAAAHGRAILSAVDPDQFASRFGYHAFEDDFAGGLTRLLEGNQWQQLGEAGRDYVRQVFSLKPTIDRHIEIYTELLARRPVA
jgi:glycosyltransferase involved in cell wall biosynthesis